MYKRKYGTTKAFQPFKAPRRQGVFRRYTPNRTASSKRRTYGSSALAPEKKFLDTSLGVTNFVASTDATGGMLDPSATVMVSTPAQGTTASDRDGKKIVCKYLEIKGTVGMSSVTNQTGALDPIRVFVAVVLDTQTNVAQMASENCFKNTGGTAVNNAVPMKNLLFGPRFRLLKTHTFLLHFSPASYDGTNIEIGGDFRTFTWFIPLKNLVINFNAGTTTSIVNVIDNSIHVVGYASSALAFITYAARMRFIG